MNVLRRLLGDADVPGQREGGLAVEQRVVDDLRAAPQLVRVEAGVGAEHLQRRAVVDVLADAERLDQRLVAGQVRQHPQLDLRVVGRDQHVAGRGDERAADLAADLGADRNVLQVGIGAAQAAGGGHRLVEAGVHAAGLRVDQQRQRIDVGALQLLQAAPVQDQARQLVRLSASSSSTSTAVDAERVLPVFFSAGRFSRSNSTSPSCFGELTLNSIPAIA